MISLSVQQVINIKLVQYIFDRLLEQGDIYLGEYELVLCTG